MANRYQGPGYQSYYGRKTGGGVRSLLKWIIVFLLAVLVVAIGALYAIQEWLVFDDTGAHVVFPWASEEDEPEPLPSDTADPEESPSEPAIIIEEPPEPTLRELAAQTLQAVAVTQTGLLSGRADEQAAAAGGNAVLVTMKNDDGTLNYVSSVPLAVELGASASDGSVNQAVRELVEKDIYTIAQVSCFRDGVVGAETKYALLTNSGWRWRDFSEVRWSCAANETVQNYLVEVCVELAQMGFDEILLTNCGYPAAGSGELGWIRKGTAYPAGALDGVVSAFLAQLRTALEPYEVKLSVRARGSELAGLTSEATETGLTTALLLDGFDHIWVTAEEAAAVVYASEADRARAEERLVPYGPSAGGAETAWAIINGT